MKVGTRRSQHHYENIPIPIGLKENIIQLFEEIKRCTNLDMSNPNIGWHAVTMSKLFFPVANYCKLNQREGIESIYSLVDILLNDIYKMIQESPHTNQEKTEELKRLSLMFNVCCQAWMDNFEDKINGKLC